MMAFAVRSDIPFERVEGSNRYVMRSWEPSSAPSQVLPDRPVLNSAASGAGPAPAAS
ncbi:MAG: hypothetical protein ACO32I_09600 [Candidatus Limnocylindrus sp.]